MPDRGRGRRLLRFSCEHPRKIWSDLIYRMDLARHHRHRRWRMSRRTALGQVLGLGSAKEGADHWWAQRWTAVALALLGVW
ncbi:MAG: hypothetical protein AAFU56_10640, partial [Pseudomonadota bacterium]